MSFLIGTLCFVLLSVSLFMILLVLIQRGRGGGLAGAFGGMGGQSAFGTRAGDTFTRITIVLAVIWVLLAGGIGMLMRRDAEASKTGANSVFEEGKDAKDKTEDAGSEGDSALDPAKSGESTADPTDGKSKALDTVPSELEKSGDSAPAKAESGEAEAVTPAADAEATGAKATESNTPDGKSVEPEASKAAPAEPVEPAAPAEPAASGDAPPASTPNP